MTVVASERYALQIIQELGEAKPETIGQEMGFSADYTALLCRSLWKGGYITGSVWTGYQVTQKGEELLAELGMSRK